VNRDATARVTSEPVRRVLILSELNVANRISAELVTELRNVGVEAHTVTVLGRGPLHEQLEAQGLTSFALDCRSALAYPAGAFRLACLAKRLGAQVIHGVEPIATMVAVMSRAFDSRAAVIYHRQHVCTQHAKQTLLSRLSAHGAHVTIAVSKAAARAAIEIDGADRHRVQVAHNGLPELRHVTREELESLRAHLGIPGEARIVSIVARMRIEKGHRTLISALDLLPSRTIIPIHLVIVGTGPYESEIREFAAAARTRDRVHFVGDHFDVAPWFRLSDVIANPSDRDACPLAVIEAMSAVRTIVATQVGGVPELIEQGTSGLLVEPSDPSALADAIASVVASPELARALATGARKRYEEHFSIAAMVRRFREIYELADGVRRGNTAS
jgi:glycosyltransferase involved in cell wall biosynthesis